MRKAITYFLYPVESLDDLPTPVGEAVRPHLQEDHIHSIIVIPPQDYAIRREETRWKRNLSFRWRATPQRTLVFGDHQIVMVEADKDGAINTLVIPLDCLIYANLGTILLYAYLELAWVNQGEIDTLKIEFNAVREQFIHQEIERVRTQLAARMPASTLRKTATEIQLPFKFNNYLKYSLLPNERIYEAVYQPAIRQGNHWLKQYLSPNRTVALTDCSLLILEEEAKRDFLGLKSKNSNQMNYGIIIRCCPIQNVQAVDFRQADDISWLQLTLGIDDTRVLADVPLSPDNAEVLRETWNALHRVTT